MATGDRKPAQRDDSGFHIRYIFYAALVLLFLLAILSHHPEDAAVLDGGSTDVPQNRIGYTGAWLSFRAFLYFGLATYLIEALLILRMIRCFIPVRPLPFWKSMLGGFMMTLGTMLLLALTPEIGAEHTDALGIGRKEVPQLALSGGVIGQWMAAPEFNPDGVKAVSPELAAANAIPPGWLRNLIGAPGTMICAWALLLVGGLMIFLSDWAPVVFAAGDDQPGRLSSTVARQSEDDEEEETEEPAPAKGGGLLARILGSGDEDRAELPPEPGTSAMQRMLERAEERGENSENATETLPDEDDDAEKDAPPPEPPPPPEETTTPDKLPRRGAGLNVRQGQSGERVRTPIFGGYELPSIKMLTQGKESAGEDREEIFRAREILQQTLESFDIPGNVTGYTTGPRVTRFEITLSPGVNVKKVEQIADNITMNLAATSVRVLAPIPGRPVVGVEVSNTKSEAVFMRSVMESEAWQSGKADIPLALGKDVSGRPVVIDLAKAPHLLVAGATGTGKSVCTNSLIMSLLFKFAPDDLKLIMVDPKIVEFEEYRELPHLLAPLINDSAKVPVALRWVANEMDRRYGVLAKVHVKKLSEFNRRPPDPEPVYDDDGNEIPAKMPYLVVVIDELADLMMTEAKKDVETNITRIAQKGRAAGIHIVVATQRPSTNIITGVIKANLPTRFCFQVRSGVDSRVVIDTVGAEKLLGMGDMLLMSPSSMNIERVQGAFVPDADIRNVVKFVCGQAKPSFNAAVLTETAEDADGEVIDELDLEEPDDQDRADIAPLIKKYLRQGDSDEVRKALEVVILDRKVSTSYLQRRLKIGYNRAAEIVDLLEERHVVGPPSGSGNKREILIFDGTDFADKEEF